MRPAYCNYLMNSVDHQAAVTGIITLHVTGMQVHFLILTEMYAPENARLYYPT